MGKYSPATTVTIILALFANIITPKTVEEFFKVPQVKTSENKRLDTIISTFPKRGTRIRIFLKSPTSPHHSCKVYELKMKSPFSLRDRAKSLSTDKDTLKAGQFNSTELSAKFYPRLQWGLALQPVGGRSINIEQIKFNFSWVNVVYAKNGSRNKYYTRVTIPYLELKYVDQKDGSGGEVKTLGLEGYELIRENKAFDTIYLVLVLGSLGLSLIAVPYSYKCAKKVPDKIFPALVYSIFVVLSWIPMTFALVDRDWVGLPLFALATRSINIAAVIFLIDHLTDKKAMNSR